MTGMIEPALPALSRRVQIPAAQWRMPARIWWVARAVLLCLACLLGGPQPAPIRGGEGTPTADSRGPATPVTRAASPWPTYQHDFQRTGRGIYRGPVTQPVVEWSVLHGSADAGLILGPGKIVYVRGGSATVALDRAGQVVQTLPVGGGCQSVPTLGPDGNLYFASDFTWFGVSPRGDIRWRYDFPSGCMNSTAAIDDNGIMYYTAGEVLWAVSAWNGNYQWSLGLSEYVGSTPALGYDGTIYVTSGATPYPWIAAINPDGTVKWSDTHGYVTHASVGADGTVYSAEAGVLVAHRPDGTTRWEFHFSEHMCDQTVPAIAADGTIYLGTAPYFRGRDHPDDRASDSEAVLYAVNPDGTQKWRYEASASPGANGICMAPIVDNQDNVFFGTEVGQLFALNKDGVKLWDMTMPSVQSLRTSPVIVEDGVLYIVQGAWLYSLREPPQ